MLSLSKPLLQKQLFHF